jgi:hypothetical protein
MTKYLVLRELADAAGTYEQVQMIAAYSADAACRIAAAELKGKGVEPPFRVVAIPVRSFQPVTIDERPAQLQIVR